MGVEECTDVEASHSSISPHSVGSPISNLDHAAMFYETRLGLRRLPASPPGAVVFDTAPIPFAVREPLPGIDLDAGPCGLGVALWLRADDAQALHDQLVGQDASILTEPFDSPFGRAFVVRDPDGYAVTIHDAG